MPWELLVASFSLFFFTLEGVFLSATLSKARLFNLDEACRPLL